MTTEKQRTKPSYEEQIAEHRRAVMEFRKQIEIADACGFRKSAAHWRRAMATCESLIRQLQRLEETR